MASPSDIAQELSVRVPNVSYHTRALEGMGLIRLVRTEQRRGARQHYYEALGPVRITDRVWGQVPEVVKSAIADAAVAGAVRTMSAAATRDGFARPEALAARRVMNLDEQGFRELAAAANDLIAQSERIEKDSAHRLAKMTGHPQAVQTGLVIGLFDAPPSEAVVSRGKPPRVARARAVARRSAPSAQ